MHGGGGEVAEGGVAEGGVAEGEVGEVVEEENGRGGSGNNRYYCKS